MFERINVQKQENLFLPMSRRPGGKGVYFVRLCSGGNTAKDLIWRYHELARVRGAIVEDSMPNPSEQQLSYMKDKLGDAFQPNADFIQQALEKWAQMMSAENRRQLAEAMAAQFEELRALGKNESVQRNVYTKMMCWLYYHFMRLAPSIGEDDPPRVLYVCKEIGGYELIFLRMLSSLGVDILLVMPKGDASYTKQDPMSQWSEELLLIGGPLPEDFTLKKLRKEKAVPPTPPAPKPAEQKVTSKTGTSSVPVTPVQKVTRPAPIVPESRYPAPQRTPCTNAWMKQALMTEILTPNAKRGDDFHYFYNAFIRVNGVPDTTTYASELLQLYQKLQKAGRSVVIVDDTIPLPTPQEIDKVPHRSYHSIEELIVDLAMHFPSSAYADLLPEMRYAFINTMKEAAKEEPNLNKLVVSGVYIICWMTKYNAQLFHGYKGGENPVFILLGGCKGVHDALFLRFLSRLPVDVLILCPDKEKPCTVQSETLLELNNDHSMQLERFPRDMTGIKITTVAAGAQHDLDNLLYGSGIYKADQFSQADAIPLQTTYDELFQQWDNELRFRPSFSGEGRHVTLPVLYARVNGVESGFFSENAYWTRIKKLTNKKDVLLYDRFPILQPHSCDGKIAFARKVLNNGKLNFDALKGNPNNPFRLLGPERQYHLLSKIQLMLDRRIIHGTFVNGTEYTILATIFSLSEAIIQRLQNFDFSKSNPKVLCISVNKQCASLEDTILLTFLSMVGCDVLFFVPTGYQTFGEYLTDYRPIDHHIGEFNYKMTVPDMKKLTGIGWIDIITTTLPKK